MRILFFTLSISLLAFSCKSKPKPSAREFSFPQIGWQVKIPSDFIAMDSASIQAMDDRGKKAIEKTYDTTVDFSATTTLLNVKKGQLNHFAGTITPFDSTKDGDWSEANEVLKEVMMNTFETQAPSMKLDTSSGIEMIDDLEFQKFHIKTTFPNNKILNTIMYSRLHKGYDFGITLTFTDDKIGRELMVILHSSKFDK